MQGSVEIFQGVRFKYPWRKYQQRVLAELDDHLNDDHLHIVAPPGSGKTVLGLEVMLRLNKPTLILAPTLAIRNQWITRFCELFLENNSMPEWISRDIRDPRLLTVVTYQGLHAAFTGGHDVEDDSSNEEECEYIEEETSISTETDGQVIQALKDAGIRTILVDEAHHLKNAWWETLSVVKHQLQPVIVGLTATPPYDVSPAEWGRYLELNGPVDAEISVPELMREGNLCPHQDYLYLSRPTATEIEKILAFHDRTSRLIEEIKEDDELSEALTSHPFYTDPLSSLDSIYNKLEDYSSLLIFLHGTGHQIRKDHLKVIAAEKITIPALNNHWLEKLLGFYLFSEDQSFQLWEDHRDSLGNRLRHAGLLHRKTIDLENSMSVQKRLTSSLSKLNSICEITDFEYGILGHRLRMVILTDFIRRDFLNEGNSENEDLTKMGVVPIFEVLRRKFGSKIKLGVLTGSLVILPAASIEEFLKQATHFGAEEVRIQPLPYNSSYCLIYSPDSLKHHIVQIVTALFSAGEIEVLTGTKALLGEGWDAPAINSIILASFVGSFVLSNQMRGRAIRTDPADPGKTANIWHLACVDEYKSSGGPDIELMERRFRGFVGISFDHEPVIENGFSRLKLDKSFTGDYIKHINEQMMSHAGDRSGLSRKWEKAISSGNILIEEMAIPFAGREEYNKVKRFYFHKTLRNLIVMATAGVAGMGPYILEALFRSIRSVRTSEQLIAWSVTIGVFLFTLFGWKAWVSGRLYIKYRDIGEDLENIGKALANSLMYEGTIKTDRNQLKVITKTDEYGGISCYLEGGTTFERSTFLSALEEIVNEIDNPRYVIIRKSSFLSLISQRDYHAVPELVGRNKKYASRFADEWKELVGKCKLVYTRTLEGRRLLLMARLESLSAQFNKSPVRRNIWKS